MGKFSQEACSSLHGSFPYADLHCKVIAQSKLVNDLKECLIKTAEIEAFVNYPVMLEAD